MDSSFKSIPIGTAEVIKKGGDLTIIGVGASVPYAIQAAGELSLNGIESTVVNGRFIKPLDAETIISAVSATKHLITVEENVLTGGFGSAVSSLLHQAGINDIKVKKIAIPDIYVEHGTPSLLRAKYGLDSDGIVKAALALLPQVKKIHC
jgi:1-deoxy-D-xylulose-5-phosphate synthase